jgi:hypothetical protein
MPFDLSVCDFKPDEKLLLKASYWGSSAKAIIGGDVA